jgi:hypothetical protein
MKKSSDSNRGIGQVPNSQIADWGSGARPTVSQTAINAVVTETNQIINHTGNSHPSAAMQSIMAILGKR